MGLGFWTICSEQLRAWQRWNWFLAGCTAKVIALEFDISFFVNCAGPAGEGWKKDQAWRALSRT
eukprot:3206061-Rhodomonas_salina.4